MSSSVGIHAWNGARPITDLDAADRLDCDQLKGMRITSSHRPTDMKPRHRDAGWRRCRVGFLIGSVEWWSCSATTRPTGGPVKRPVDVAVMLRLSQSQKSTLKNLGCKLLFHLRCLAHCLQPSVFLESGKKAAWWSPGTWSKSSFF